MAVAFLDVNPRPSGVDWDALEREAATHSRCHSGPPRAYQDNSQRGKKKSQVLTGVLGIHILKDLL